VSQDDFPFDGSSERREHVDRPEKYEPRNIYAVGDKTLSIFDLLKRFTEEKWQHNGISRLADLHLKVGESARYRLDGELVPLADADRLTHDMVKGLVYPLLRVDQIEKLDREYPHDVDAAFHLEEEGGMNFRINAFHDRDGLAAVIRSLPRTVPPMDTLGFPDVQVLKRILKLRQGLVVVTGITGSGKSTTIASILAELNKQSALRVITLEDPIEYIMKNEKCLISQREVGLHTPTFHGGLRSALREDPDVIVVGEIRDTETATLALSAAETGHLVFSTLHTRDAKGVITRLVDLFPAERSKEIMSQLSFSLSYVVAQKLLPKKSGTGRIATYEILKNVPSIANLIRTGNWHQIYATMQLQSRERMITMEKHLSLLYEQGSITREVALQYANDPSQLQLGNEPQPQPEPVGA
jgi:twitching motility protein PilT